MCERFSPVAANDHSHRECRAVLVGFERAQIVGDALGQHGHDAVGKIDRVAAKKRLAIERGTGRHVMADIGNGDRKDKSSGVVGIGIGRGVHRVVVILGVHRIDGDERKLAPILAAGHADGFCRLGFGQSIAAEKLRNAVCMNGDEADRAFAIERAELFLDARCRRAMVALPDDMDGDEVAVARIVGGARRNGEFPAELLLVDRDKTSAAAGNAAEDAEHALRRAVDDLDDTAGETNGVIFVAGFFDA